MLPRGEGSCLPRYFFLWWRNRNAEKESRHVLEWIWEFCNTLSGTRHAVQDRGDGPQYLCTYTVLGSWAGNPVFFRLPGCSFVSPWLLGTPLPSTVISCWETGGQRGKGKTKAACLPSYVRTGLTEAFWK